MQLVDYNITFVHIKGKHSILADAISRLKTLNIYKEALENPTAQVVNTSQQVFMEVCATTMHTLSIDMLLMSKSRTKRAKNWCNK